MNDALFLKRFEDEKATNIIGVSHDAFRSVHLSLFANDTINEI